jgi:hypothetical protein
MEHEDSDIPTRQEEEGNSRGLDESASAQSVSLPKKVGSGKLPSLGSVKAVGHCPYTTPPVVAQ